jgi:hypothetical protein
MCNQASWRRRNEPRSASQSGDSATRRLERVHRVFRDLKLQLTPNGVRPRNSTRNVKSFLYPMYDVSLHRSCISATFSSPFSTDQTHSNRVDIRVTFYLLTHIRVKRLSEQQRTYGQSQRWSFKLWQQLLSGEANRKHSKQARREAKRN